jgi:hypothetical protein
MKKREKIQARIAAILAISDEAEVLSEMRRYAESLPDEEFRFAHEYAADFLSKRAAAVQEAFTEAIHSSRQETT